MIKLKELGKNIDLIDTKILELPLDSLPSNAEQIMSELQKPITVGLYNKVVKSGRDSKR